MNHCNVPMTASKNLSKWTSTICEAPVVEVQSFVIWSALLTIALLLVKEVEAQAATLSQAISKTVWLIFCYLQKGYTSPPSPSLFDDNRKIFTQMSSVYGIQDETGWMRRGGSPKSITYVNTRSLVCICPWVFFRTHPLLLHKMAILRLNQRKQNNFPKSNLSTFLLHF